MRRLSQKRRNVERRQERARVKAIVDRADFLRALLDENGAVLSGFDPGVLAYPKSSVRDGTYYQTLSFGHPEWEWLEPLLLELRRLRAGEA